MNVEDFFKWYNLIFYISILFGVLLIAAMAFGLGADSDIDFDADGEIDIDSTFFSKALSIFGIGRCPASIVMFTALLLFGGTGIILNQIFAPYLVVVSVAGASFTMLTLTRVIALGVAKIMPNTETYGITSETFIGRLGRVVVKTNEEFGKVQVVDEYGSLHRLSAKAFEGSSYDIDTEVLIIDYKDETYFVASPNETK